MFLMLSKVTIHFFGACKMQKTANKTINFAQALACAGRADARRLFLR